MARVFYVTFKDYMWSHEEHVDQVGVELTNAAFASELNKDFQYRWKANNRILYVAESRAMDALRDARPPPPPPGRPQAQGEAIPPTFALTSHAEPRVGPTASEPSAKRHAGSE